MITLKQAKEALESLNISNLRIVSEPSYTQPEYFQLNIYYGTRIHLKLGISCLDIEKTEFIKDDIAYLINSLKDFINNKLMGSSEYKIELIENSLLKLFEDCQS